MKSYLFISILSLSFLINSFSQDELKPQKIAENLYVASGLWCNATFFIADDQVYVFDCGANFTQGEIMKSQIKQVTDKPVKTIVYTHYHFDHTYGASAFPVNIDIIAHENLVENLKKQEEELINTRENELPSKIENLKNELEEAEKTDTSNISRINKEIQQFFDEITELKKVVIRYPTITFKDTLIIKTEEEIIRIIYPNNAHTNDNCVIEFENANTIYLGDILFTKCYPFIDIDAGADVENWKKVLTDYANKQYNHYISGHYEIPTSEDLLSLASYLEDMEHAVFIEMKSGKSLEEMQNTMEKLENYKHFRFEFAWPQNIEVFYKINSEK